LTPLQKKNDVANTAPCATFDILGASHFFDKQYHKSVSMRVPFRDGTLPPMPEGLGLSEIRFMACKAPTVLLLVHVFDATNDGGVVRQGVWSVSDSNERERYVCVHDGKASIVWLLDNYGFLENENCTNGRRGEVVFADWSDIAARTHFSGDLFPEWIGVGQSPGHGWCWYSSLCTVLFGNEELAGVLRRSAEPALRQLMDRALYDSKYSFALQQELWNLMGLGHDPEQAAHLDRGNAPDEYPKLLTHLRVTHETILYNVAKGYPTTAGNGRSKRASQVLSIRLPSSGHSRLPLSTEIKAMRRGRWHTYSLRGIVVGSHQCGHQVALVRLDKHGTLWILIDADALMHGLRGPLIVFPRGVSGADVWKEFSRVAMSTYYGLGKANQCALSPDSDNASVCTLYMLEGDSTAAAWNAEDEAKARTARKSPPRTQAEVMRDALLEYHRSH
jgi:hypothetical protein